MKLALIVMILHTSLLFAQNTSLILTRTASCNSLVDINESKRTNQFSLEETKVVDLGDKIELTLTVKLYKCIKTENGYAFEINEDHMQTRYTQAGFATGDQMEVEKLDLEKNLLFMNEKFEIVQSVDLSQNNGEQTIRIEIEKDKLSLNKFPAIASRGKYFTTVMLRSKSQFNSSLSTIGPMYLNSSEIKIFFKID